MRKSYTRLPVLALITGCSLGGVEVGSGGSQTDGPLGRASQAATGCITPRSNLVVRSSTTLCPGTYDIGDPEGDGVIQIQGHQVTLNISGVTLRGTGTGYGITSTNFNGVIIKSSPTSRGNIRNYRSAILINGGASHQIAENVLSNNAKRPLTHTVADFLDVWAELEDQIALGQIGNGVVLRNVVSATITNNKARFQQNGISLFNSSNVTMQGNDCSDNQGWGIHLHRSSNNTVKNNRADNVNLAASTYCHEVQTDACDTAGILVIKASNGNLIQSNSFKNGGDGIFSAALGPPGATQYGADHNRYVANDVSFAKHLGIEATFADDVLVENNTIGSVGRSGIWLGGSKNSTIRGNIITNSGWSGIENEGTQNFTIENNRITGSAQNGIFLRDLGSFGRQSTGQFIARNTIQGNGEFGIRAVDTQSINATGNVISSNGLGSVHLELRNESRLTGPININESQLLDAPAGACHGVDVTCSCRVFNGDQQGCNATSGCSYFACSDRCEVAGTSSCDAGCGGCTGSCRDHDGNVQACDGDPQDCAYYFCSNRCLPEGTPLEVGCACEPFNGDEAACNAAPGCEYFACSGGCFFDDTPLCQANCCGTGQINCPISSVTNVTSNYWGTTDPAVIDASICGADLNFVPFKTSP